MVLSGEGHTKACTVIYAQGSGIVFAQRFLDLLRLRAVVIAEVFFPGFEFPGVIFGDCFIFQLILILFSKRVIPGI